MGLSPSRENVTQNRIEMSGDYSDKLLRSNPGETPVMHRRQAAVSRKVVWLRAAWFALLLMNAAPTATGRIVRADDERPAAVKKTAAEREVDFDRDVRPIFARHCFDCHGPDARESNLRLDRRASLLRGGDSGEPAIVPGQSGDSHLIRLVSGDDPRLVMPPSDERLTAAEIGILRTWIDRGAKWTVDDPTADEPEALTTEFWSFQPLADVAPPRLNSPWIANPIDAFVLQKLREAGLEPNPQADWRTLVRRLYLDLHGLPPTPKEIAAFLADERPDAWERLVDRLLASPQYGQRWARHWLDVVRFAETDGFEMNQERPHAWRYRDWVIDALNDDRPYDRFVFEQLAGDAVSIDEATGFLVAGAYDKVKSPDVGLTLMQRQDELADMVGVTGTTFLGLTLGCARCHNHKFDPILQRDYYAVQAVFAGVRHADRAISAAHDSERRRQLAETERHVAAVETELVELGVRPPVSARETVERFEPVRAKFVRFSVQATNTGNEPCLDELEIYESADERNAEPAARNVALASAGARATSSGDYVGNSKHKLEHLNDGRYGNEWSWISNERGRGWVQIELAEPMVIDRIVWGRDRNEQYTDRLATDYVIEVAIEPGEWQIVASSAGRLGADGLKPSGDLPAAHEARVSELLTRRQELQKYRQELSAPLLAYAGRFEPPPPTHRLFRGDPLAPREVVDPDALSVLGSLDLDGDAPERRRRVALAQWIGSPDNPLTARVLVNRLWHYHFGRGIVETPSDFGTMGFRPTHPELLDWLAGEFLRRGWSMKHIHRLIVSSNTYRQSAAPQERGLTRDADARWLWRFPPRRLEAEAIRDAMLAVSGALDRRMGGPGFSAFEPNSNYVRVYEPKQQFGPAEWRRMIYQTKVRMEPDAVFGAFDCPDAGQAAPQRSRSTTALQSLNLFNSGFVLQQADLFARRLRREAGDDPAAQVRRGFALAFGRQPDAAEMPAAVALVEVHGLPALCRALFNANEFLFLP
jgi:mono/diheme cytochrome c family protein